MEVQYYQNLGMPSDEALEKKNRKKSRYWNEGKWEYYIEPLLPKDCEDMTFVDVGCNAGLFLKLAKDKGFRDVIGIEKSRKAYERAIKYRDYLGYDYKVLNRMVGYDFSFDEVQVADVTLLSNVHYYFQISDWLKYLDQLQYKTCYCLIITRPLRRVFHWMPLTQIADVRHYFRGWKEVGAIYRTRHKHIEERDDPSPRVLWSLLFKSKLKRVKMENLERGAPGGMVKLPTADLIEQIANRKKVDIEKTDYYKTWRTRMERRWDEKTTKEFVRQKIDLMYDIKKNGMKDPILVQLDNKIIDGGHRIAILKELGYKSIIARTI